MRRLAPALLLFLAAPLAAQTPAPAAPAAAAPTPVKLTPDQEANLLSLGKQYTRWFFSGAADSLAGAFDAFMLEKSGGVSGISERMAQISERVGAPAKVLVERIGYRKGQPEFWYEAEFSGFPNEAVVVRWVLTVDGKVTGAGVNPKSAAPSQDGMP